MLELFQKDTGHLPTISEDEMSDAEVLVEIEKLKAELSDKVVVLGHHYQNDDIIRFADFKGDSLKLAEIAKGIDKEFIIFCGVHFMAETADILNDGKKTVILPDLAAGCSMADMATSDQIEKAWEHIAKATKEKVIPITYINCAATLKSFVGKHDGSICTSSNAKKVITWALDRGEKLLFFPDQHLGRNTCADLGISLDDMVVYNPNMYQGGLSPEQIANAKVILWYGYCSVHQGFTKDQVVKIKKDHPDMTVIVHPECPYEVVKEAHDNGSTAYIIEQIKNAPSGASFAVGTEVNLVNRLANEFPDKKIISLSPYQCLCTTMYRVRPRWLLASFRSIADNKPINRIQVSKEDRAFSNIALERMLNIV